MKYEILKDLTFNEIDDLIYKLLSFNHDTAIRLDMLKDEVNDLRKKIGLTQKYNTKIHGRGKKYKESHYMEDFDFSKTITHNGELYVPFNEVVFQLVMMEMKGERGR